MPNNIRPKCAFCRDNHGIEQDATKLAAQSEDQGQTVNWMLVCDDHADGWNDGSNWTAPMFTLTADPENPKVLPE